MSVRPIPQSGQPIYVTLAQHGQGVRQIRTAITYSTRREGLTALGAVYERLQEVAGVDGACTWMPATNVHAVLDEIRALADTMGVRLCDVETQTVRLAAINRRDFSEPVTPGEAAILRDGALRGLAAAKAGRDRLEASIAEQVRLLRIARVSWEAIGEALDVSKQAVQQRFGGDA